MTDIMKPPATPVDPQSNAQRVLRVLRASMEPLTSADISVHPSLAGIGSRTIVSVISNLRERREILIVGERARRTLYALRKAPLAPLAKVLPPSINKMAGVLTPIKMEAVRTGADDHLRIKAVGAPT